MKKFIVIIGVVATLAGAIVLLERHRTAPIAHVAYEMRYVSPELQGVFDQFSACWGRVVAGEKCNYRALLAERNAVLAEHWPQIFDWVHYGVRHGLVTGQGARFLQDLVTEHGTNFVRDQCRPGLQWRVYGGSTRINELLVDFWCGDRVYQTPEDLFSRW